MTPGRLWIAFTGAHGGDRSALAGRAAALAEEALGRVEVLGSAARFVAGAGGYRIDGRGFWTQWHAMGARRTWMLERRAAGVPRLVSPRCGIDEVAYQGVLVADLIQRAQAASDLLGPNGEPVPSPADRDATLAQAMLTGMLAAAVEEFGEWDFVYFRRVAPPEYDAERAPFRVVVDMQINAFVQGTPAFRERVTELPGHPSDAREFLAEERGRWREHAEWKEEGMTEHEEGLPSEDEVTAPARRVVVFPDKGGEWRWRRVAGNNEVVAQSEGYVSRAGAVRSAEEENPGVPVEVEEPEEKGGDPE
jgi:uncharacterized protein YegP (UPF0339 family)